MTPKEQIQSAELTQESLDTINANISDAVAESLHLISAIDNEQHPEPSAAAQTIAFHLASAQSMANHLERLNNQFGADGQRRYEEERFAETQAQGRESARSAGDSRELVEQIARTLAESGLGSGTILVVRTEVEDPEDSEPTVH